MSCPQEETKAYRKAYYAAVSYMDTLVGRVLDALVSTGKGADTVTLFMGDHGWQLGEMDEWRKMTVRFFPFARSFDYRQESIGGESV